MAKWKSNANAQAMSKGVRWFAFIIVTVVAVYGDIMFLQLMLPAFPDNWMMRALACIGAIATAFSVILLYIGKSRWFRPGGQLIWAYWFTAIEFAILAANCIVAFAYHQSSNLDWVLHIWFYLCPVTPLVSAGGWVLINHFDRDNQEMHEDMELEDQQRGAMRAYKLAEHQAHMQILHKTLEQKTAYVNRWIDSQAGQSGIEEAAEGFGRQVLSGLTGYPVIPAIKSPTVDGTIQPPETPVQPAAQPIDVAVPMQQLRGYLETLSHDDREALIAQYLQSASGNGHTAFQNGQSS